jgi:hypothetical protein
MYQTPQITPFIDVDWQMPTKSFMYVSAGDKIGSSAGTCLTTHLHCVGRRHITNNIRGTASSQFFGGTRFRYVPTVIHQEPFHSAKEYNAYISVCVCVQFVSVDGHNIYFRHQYTTSFMIISNRYVLICLQFLLYSQVSFHLCLVIDKSPPGFGIYNIYHQATPRR